METEIIKLRKKDLYDIVNEHSDCVRRENMFCEIQKCSSVEALDTLEQYIIHHFFSDREFRERKEKLVQSIYELYDMNKMNYFSKCFWLSEIDSLTTIDEIDSIHMYLDVKKNQKMEVDEFRTILYEMIEERKNRLTPKEKLDLERWNHHASTFEELEALSKIIHHISSSIEEDLIY